MKRATLYLILILIVSSIVLGSGSLLNSASESNDKKNETKLATTVLPSGPIAGIPANAEEAAQQGVKGVIIIKSPDKRSEIYVPKGETRNYTIQLSYISYTNQTSAYVALDPKGSLGSDVGRGGLWLSDYVTYTPMGYVEVRVKRKTNVTMTVTAPMDVDLSFPFMAPGIRSKYPIYDKTG